MAALHDSSSSDGEDFEGFVVSPDEKASYKVWSKKQRRLSEAFDDSGSEENESDEEDDDDDDDEEEEEDEYESDNEETLIENDDEENDELDDALDDIQLQDSGDEALSTSHTDQCPVCLMSLKEQLLGTPNNCPHVFCFECIQEWAKNATTCPVGRKPFTEILVHATRKGPILQRIPVEERRAGDDEEEDDPTYCEVCGECDREDRMLLCDGCDHGYHMECLNPPVEFVPVEEWYCPGCSSHEDPEEHLEEEHREGGLREVPRARATRGRPRGSTARRVSVSGRTDTTRRARTVASTRGRARTGRGRGRGRGSSRGRGRGGRRTTTRGRSTTKTTTGRKKKRRKKRGQSKKKASRTRTKRRKTSSKTKTLKPLKRRRIAEEDEVSPFIYEPKRRGRTVHARLLESLNSPGPATEPGRTASLGRVPFPSRLEPSSSFSLFGNAYALHDFTDREDDTTETPQAEEKTTAWSSESTNPDVLGSIFQGLDSLLSPSAQVARDGKILTTANQSPTKGSSSSNVKSSQDKLTTCEDEMKLESDFEIKRNPEEEKHLKTMDNSSNESDVKHSRKDQGNSDEQCLSRNIFEKLSSSTTADSHSGSCTKPSDTKQRAKASSSPSTSLKSDLSPPSTPVSSKSTLSGFRIPKRNSKSQDEPNQTSLNTGNCPIHVKQETSSSISNFKIPKRTNGTSSVDSSRNESSKVNIAKPASVKYTGQKLTSSSSGVEQNLPLPHYTSSSKGVTHSGCVTESKAAGSSLAYSNSVRPIVHETLQRRNSLNSSTTANEGSVTSACNVTRNHAKTICSNSAIPGTSISTTSLSHAAAIPVRVTSSISATRYPAKDVSSITQCHTTTTTNRTAQSVTNSNSETTRHATNLINIPRSHTKTSNSVSPLTKVAPLIDHLKPMGEKEQRRSNIEIIKMLQEKQRNMREQMSGDSSQPGHSGVTDTRALLRKVIPVSGKTPTCSREVPLPVAIVKPSRQMPSVTVNAPSSLRSSSLESSPVKSIASGIINAHSCNTEEFKRVRSESDPVRSGLKRSSSYTEREAKARKHDVPGTGAEGNRDQQRKLGIARLQRQQQIVDEVKLALKPFFKHGEIDKDDYKLIMRKSVEKIKESSSSVDRDRVCRLVKKYIKKVKGVNWSP